MFRINFNCAFLFSCFLQLNYCLCLGFYLLCSFPPLLFINWIQTNAIALQCSIITEYAIWQARGKQLRPILLHVYMQKILSLSVPLIQLSWPTVLPAGILSTFKLTSHICLHVPKCHSIIQYDLSLESSAV